MPHLVAPAAPWYSQAVAQTVAQVVENCTRVTATRVSQHPTSCTREHLRAATEHDLEQGVRVLSLEGGQRGIVQPAARIHLRILAVWGSVFRP